jgi:hypothetical protein
VPLSRWCWQPLYPYQLSLSPGRVIIPLSKQALDEYHNDAVAWERRHGTRAELPLAFWRSIGFIPGTYMTVGMNPKRAAWLDRVLERLKRN